MTRKEFWEWMATCPAKEDSDFSTIKKSGWFVADDNGTEARIFFYFEEEHEDA